MTDKVKEQITLSDKLVRFLGLTYHIPKVLYIYMSVPNTVSFGLDFTINQLQGFFQTVSHKSLPYCQLCLGLKAFFAASTLTQQAVEAKQSVIVSLAVIKVFCK